MSSQDREPQPPKSNSSPDDLPLGETLRDRAVTLGKGALGTIPIVGSILAEVVTTLIPQQRIKRLEDYVRRLSQRIGQTEGLRERLIDPQVQDVFEEGAWQSARALSDERRDQIASVVASGLAGDQKNAIEARRLLNIMASLDDDQIVILASFLQRNKQDADFHTRHARILKTIGTHLNSSREDHEAETIQNLAREQLTRLGLIAAQYKQPKKGEVPEFDPKTGLMKAQSRTLSPLGRMLLHRIGLAGPDEF